MFTSFYDYFFFHAQCRWPETKRLLFSSQDLREPRQETWNRFYMETREIENEVQKTELFRNGFKLKRIILAYGN